MHDPTPRGAPEAGSPKVLAFVVSEDSLFAAHELPTARAAIAMGLSVAVITRVRLHRATIEAAGARVVDFDAGQSRLNPMAAGYAAGQLSAILKSLKADIAHCIAPRGILVGGTAAAMAGISRRVYEPGGFGALELGESRARRFSRLALKSLIRGPLASRHTRYLCRSPDEAHALGLDPSDVTVTIADSNVTERAVAGLYAELLSA